jgi:hypothetical protein
MKMPTKGRPLANPKDVNEGKWENNGGIMLMAEEPIDKWNKDVNQAQTGNGHEKRKEKKKSEGTGTCERRRARAQGKVISISSQAPACIRRSFMPSSAPVFQSQGSDVLPITLSRRHWAHSLVIMVHLQCVSSQ